MFRAVYFGFLRPRQHQSGQQLSVAFLAHDEEAIVGVGAGAAGRSRTAAAGDGVEVVGAAVVAQFEHQVGPLVAAPVVTQLGRHLQHFGLLGADLVATQPVQFGAHNWQAKANDEDDDDEEEN